MKTAIAPEALDGEAAVAAASTADGEALALREARDCTDTLPALRIKTIIQRTAERHVTTLEEILSRSRRAHIVRARFEAIEIVARVFPQLSTPHLGAIFGDRDHTSILYALGRTGPGAAQKAKRESAAT